MRPPRNGRGYAGKVAMLIGGTSSMGRAIARRLAQRGAACAVHYATNARVAAATVASVERARSRLGLAPRSFAFQADAARPAELASAIEAACRRARRVDFLVCLQTLPFRPEVWDESDAAATEAAFAHAFAIDALGTRTALEAARPWLERSRGSVVAFASTPVLTGYERGTAYSTAKAAVQQIARDYALKLGPLGIRVNSVAPGWVPKGTESKAELAAAVAATPLGRVATPGDIAEVVCDVLGWRHVTGHTLPVDGGESRR